MYSNLFHLYVCNDYYTSSKEEIWGGIGKHTTTSSLLGDFPIYGVEWLSEKRK